jgi:hypothetical protein
VWYGGKGNRGKGKRKRFHYKLLGDRELSLGVWMKGMEEELICTLCVILMEDG